MNLNIAPRDAIAPCSKLTIFMNFARRARINVPGYRDILRRLLNVNQIKQAFALVRDGAATGLIVIICGAFAMLPASLASSAPIGGSIGSQRKQLALQLAAEPATAPAPPEETGEADDKDVPTSQVDKYISVYESMQKDHNMTVEQAASKQGLTVAQFRTLENKIENDDTLRERVRKALRHAANPSAKESSD
jgi:hypothetical protein